MRERRDLENAFKNQFDEYRQFLEEEMTSKLDKIHKEVNDELVYRQNIENKENESK
jgi:hypothetical protein